MLMAIACDRPEGEEVDPTLATMKLSRRWGHQLTQYGEFAEFSGKIFCG
jgi:hypothetical protein